MYVNDIVAHFQFVSRAMTAIVAMHCAQSAKNTMTATATGMVNIFLPMFGPVVHFAAAILESRFFSPFSVSISSA